MVPVISKLVLVTVIPLLPDQIAILACQVIWIQAKVAGLLFPAVHPIVLPMAPVLWRMELVIVIKVILALIVELGFIVGVHLVKMEERAQIYHPLIPFLAIAYQLSVVLFANWLKLSRLFFRSALWPS